METPLAEDYTPGHSPTAVGFMAGRTAVSHASFLIPFLRPGLRLLDVGSGPEHHVGFRLALSPGMVVGIEQADTQVLAARGLPRPGG